MNGSIDRSTRWHRFGWPCVSGIVLCLIATLFVLKKNSRQHPADLSKLTTDQLETLSKTHTSLLILGEQFKRASASGDPQKALDIAHRMVKQYPNDARANNALGVASADNRDPDAAKSAFHNAMADDPRFVDPCVNLGKLAMMMGNYQQAADEFDRATTVDPKSASAWTGLGEANVELHNMQPAIESFQQAIKIAPNYAPALAHLGAFLAEMGRGDEARPHLKRAQELGDQSSVLDAGFAMAYADQPRSQDELRKALEFAASAESKGQSDGLVEYARGLALQRLNRYDEAIDAYKRVIQLSLNANGAWMGISQCYRATGQPKLADAAAKIGERVVSQRQHVNNLRYVIRASPDRIDLRKEFAELMMSTQQYDAAAEQYRYIAEHTPNSTSSWLSLAHALDLEGKKDLADQARQRAREGSNGSDKDKTGKNTMGTAPPTREQAH